MISLTQLLSLNQQQTFLAAVLAASGSLAAIAVTLLAIVPTLIEIARTRSRDYFASEAARKKIRKALSNLRHSLILYGVIMLLSTIGLLVPITSVAGFIGTCVVAIMFFVATSILIQSSYSLTTSTLEAV